MSKRASAEAAKELNAQIFSLLTRGRPLDKEEVLSLFPYRRTQALRRLREMRRLNYLSEKNDKYSMTKKGEKYLNEEEIWSLSIPSPKHWDGKWRMILFDIPATRKKYCDVLRLRLKELGLVLYQDSVWVYPYPLEKTIGKIVKFYYLSNYVSFATTEHLSGEKKLRKRFGL